MADNTQEYDENPFMNFDYDLEGDVQELEAVPAGEYQLRITGFEHKVAEFDDRQAPVMEVRLKILDNPNAKNVYHSLWMPVKGIDDDRREQARRNLKAFLEACGMAWPPAAGVDTFAPDNFIDLEVWAQLRYENDPTYGTKNRIARFTKKA